jgi:predicted metal-dependent peptidase
MKLPERTTQQRLSAARYQLLQREPFLGVLAMSLPLSLNESIPTACTNGSLIMFSPKFMSELDDATLVGVLAHEILHVASLHCTRRGSRHPLAWNFAADQAVNFILAGAEIALPDDCIPGKEGTAEQLYDALKGRSKKYTLSGDILDAGDGKDAKDAKTVEAQIRAAVCAAAAATAGRGNLSALAARMLSATAPRVDWRAVLAEWVMTSFDGWSYLPPSRRSSGAVILPACRIRTPQPIFVAVDASGSVDDRLLSRFAGEISAMGRDMWVTSFDTQSTPPVFIPCGESLPAGLIRGGGGTDIRAPFAVLGAAEDVGGIIVLTDGDGTMPTVEPEIPVLWALTCDHVAVPFGTSLLLEVDNGSK